MNQTTINRSKGYALATAVGIVYFLVACFSLGLTQEITGIATFWPASGVFVSALLLARKGETVPMFVAVGVASMAVNIAFDSSIAVAVALTTANLIEGLVISQIILRTSAVPKMLEDLRWLITFFGATITGAIISGTIATVLSGILTFPFFISWVITVSLGTLIAAPLILMIAQGPQISIAKASTRTLIAFTIGIIAIIAVSYISLTYDNGRFMFIPIIGVVAFAYKFGSRGAAISISLISAVAVFAIDISQPQDGIFSLDSNTFFLQCYLLGLLCAAWPLAAQTTEKNRLFRQYQEANEFLKRAESTAHVGHWHLSPDTITLMCSDEIYRICGLESEETADGENLLTGPSILEYYHPDDRERIRTTLIEATKKQRPFTYQARIIRGDGSICHVSSLGQPHYTEDGEFDGLFGTLQDITEQTEALLALHDARSNALNKAAQARKLSETDELTGIANRRKIFARLRKEARAAQVEKTPLTLAICDVDRFKSVNDRFGHQAGDTVLKRISEIMVEHLHSTDLVGRLGGEEFLVILPAAGQTESFEIMQRLCDAIGAERWPIVGLSKVTISAGLATMNNGDDIEDIMKKADDALYEAKQSGRDLLKTAA